eukprot:TRINITY_DN11015_c0_g2_i1.p1 TRINITY_DN11015_c0_g2~~TRINITY_DN11015_c0_g2_i1.p1  ORF type:complete len:126 (+),score=24.20 TRINITY_DN11015_c0_g2_i1:247-624(+)
MSDQSHQPEDHVVAGHHGVAKVAGSRRPITRAQAKHAERENQDPSDTQLLPTEVQHQADKQQALATSRKEMAKRHKHDPMHAEPNAGKPGTYKNMRMQKGQQGVKGAPTYSHHTYNHMQGQRTGK